MERPFVSCVPPAVSACSFGDFVICRLEKRILFYYFYVGDFNLRRFCEHIKCTHTHTHVPLSVSHTYTHTQAHTEKRQFHVQLLSRWHETTLKQEEARQQQRVWRGEAGGGYCDWGVRAEQAKIGRRVDLQLPDVQLVLLPCVRTTLLPHPAQSRMFKLTVCVCGQLNLPDGTASCNIQIVFNIICLFVK